MIVNDILFDLNCFTCSQTPIDRNANAYHFSGMLPLCIRWSMTTIRVTLPNHTVINDIVNSHQIPTPNKHSMYRK